MNDEEERSVDDDADDADDAKTKQLIGMCSIYIISDI